MYQALFQVLRKQPWTTQCPWLHAVYILVEEDSVRRRLEVVGKENKVMLKMDSDRATLDWVLWEVFSSDIYRRRENDKRDPARQKSESRDLDTENDWKQGFNIINKPKKASIIDI